MTVLQSRLSGLFFRNFGEWVTQATDARHFGSVESARHFVMAEHLADVAVLETEAPAALQPGIRIVRLGDGEGKLDAA